MIICCTRSLTGQHLHCYERKGWGEGGDEIGSDEEVGVMRG